MIGCECVYAGDDWWDTTACLIHPLTCDAIHPQTGTGCHHGPGHPGDHAYQDCVTWPNVHELAS